MSDLEWREAPDYPGYTVCEDGRIRGRRGHLLSPVTLKGGYRVVTVRDAVGARKVLVHRLVAAAFIGPRPEGHQVNHRNGVTSDNARGNLEYVTPRENAQHAIHVLHRARPRGDTHGHAKLTEAQVVAIRAAYAAGARTVVLAREYGVDRCQMWSICTRRSWRHIA